MKRTEISIEVEPSTQVNPFGFDTSPNSHSPSRDYSTGSRLNSYLRWRDKLTQMEPRIRERFNQNILAQAAECYGVSVSAVHKLASAESYIYEFKREEGSFILRIGHSLRRNVDLIEGEVDWINYLARGGASVAKAILSKNGQLVEQIDDGAGGHFLATAFVKARGRPPTDEEMTPAFIERYGQAIGQMHRLTKAYELTNPDWKRPQWDDEIVKDMIGFLPPSEDIARHKLEALIAALRLLPQDRESYGLVHQDAHGGNYFVDKSTDEVGALTFFDFDDCAYTWFASDVAIVLFYAVTGKEDASAFARYFLPHFLRGYQRENRFAPHWFAHMPDFLKLRELELYAVIHRSFDVDNLTDPWVMRYMAGRKKRVEGDVPYVEVDWSNLSMPHAG